VARAVGICNQVYVQAFNRRHGRIGTLWQGRFKSCLVESTGYLMQVLRYIDLNPVRASLVPRPEDYRWSSARMNLGLWVDPIVSFHPVFAYSAADALERASMYRKWLDQPVSDEERSEIRRYPAQERALEDPRAHVPEPDSAGFRSALRR